MYKFGDIQSINPGDY